MSALSAVAGAAIYYGTNNARTRDTLPSYEATFSVPLKCDSCVNDIKSALSKVDDQSFSGPKQLTSNPPGISSTSFSIPSRLVTVISTSPPSTLISTIQSTGRDAILRGSGNPDSAAVCILEIPPSSSIPPSERLAPPSGSTPTSSSPPPPTTSTSKYDSPVRGLARLIQLSEQLTLLDLTLTSLPKGRYSVSVRKTGDITRGSASLGPVYTGEDENQKRDGRLGVIEVDEEGRGNLVGEVSWRIWELVGRGMCVKRVNGEGVGDGEGEGEKQEVVGVVARSAGVWENEKVVCGCSGKTVWEEREEMVRKGIL
ncbi:MAG: hypothetical protein L6R41_006447 [Letrouitia leprolyta]|nr:MAG: hypothetical protein L6R41_006447 [Letrouitia leprolyta]